MQDRTEVHKQALNVPGLHAPVEIVVDRYGVPHIYADNDHDVFLAQGFNAARDRLWQLDLWRRRGLGLMAEAFGAAYVARDRAARLLLYRGDMAAEWAAYGPDARGWIEAFTAGINAYVDRIRAEPERKPFEFRALGFEPSRWSPQDVVRCRAHARVRNLDTEIARANIAARHGLDQAALLKELEPPWSLTWPEGVTPERIPDEVLATYRMATTLGELDDAEVGDTASLDGSNNWAVHAQRSTTARALLATDPHRLQELPSLRYTVHLNAPGLDIIGSGEPAVPGVSLGHNAHIAFGLTIFPSDQEDLYVYELDPEDPMRYRYRDGFETMRVERESVPVRGGPPEEVTLCFTRHGPVLHIDEASGRAYAIRTVWAEPGTAAYLASLRYQRARSWEEFVAAQSSWGAPSVNHVYADIEGNIGWIVAGLLPVRPNWDGLLPVPGDGRFEWQGFLSSARHPREYNPARQWVATANHMNLPEDFAHALHKTGFEFAPNGRMARITDVLESRPKHSLDDFARLQADVQCQVAKRLVARLAELPVMHGDAARAREMLSGWNLELTVDSAAAALFEIWFRRQVAPAQMRTESPLEVIERVEMPDVTRLARSFIESAPPSLWQQTLAAAWAEGGELLGDDPSMWAWGTLHQCLLRHPLSTLLGPDVAKRLDIGPLPKSGSALTVNNNGYRMTDFSVFHGVSWRMLADVGNWDACRAINSPGQSGDPSSPHYADHFPLWSREEYVPLLFSRDAVEAAVEARIELRPA